MNPIFINLDVTGTVKQSDIITIVSSSPQILYYRLYENKYEIDYSTLENFRLILDDNTNGNVYTISNTVPEIVDGTKYIKMILTPDMINSRLDYIVRPAVKINGVNRGLLKFKLMVREEETVDITTLTRMYTDVNNIFSKYLDSIKRDQIGEINGVIPLDNNAKVIEHYMPNDILEHIKLFHEGHGLRLDDNYYIEYWDDQDKRFYRLNILSGGEFGVPRKSKIYSYDGGIF